MASVNKVIIVGNLGRGSRDALSAERRSGDQHPRRDHRPVEGQASGETKEATEWHRISFFGRLAEIAGEYLKKGSQVYVEGSLRTRKWQDKEGQDRYTHRDPRRRACRCSAAREGGGEAAGRDAGDEPQARRGRRAGAAAAAKKPAGKFDDLEDDIPF